jgi:hypothetical protein
MLTGRRHRFQTRIKDYLKNIEKLYVAIHSTTGCKIIIDSSKNPAYAYILSMIPSIELSIIHLNRDARAVAFSWLKKKGDLRRMNPVLSSLAWDLRNVTSEMLERISEGRYIKVSYEQFAANPKEVLKRITQLIGVQASDLPFISENKVRLGTKHSIYGNPDRFRTGIVKLQIDQKWRNMGKMKKLAVDSLTWPLLIRYGYPIFRPF